MVGEKQKQQHTHKDYIEIREKCDPNFQLHWSAVSDDSELSVSNGLYYDADTLHCPWVSEGVFSKARWPIKCFSVLGCIQM